MNDMAPEYGFAISKSFEDYAKARLALWQSWIEEILIDNGRECGFSDIEKRVCEGSLILCEVQDAFVIIDVIAMPNMIKLHLWLAGGTQKALEELEKLVMDCGRGIGASKMTAIGRKGFARRAESRGWKMPKVYLEKEIPHGR